MPPVLPADPPARPPALVSHPHHARHVQVYCPPSVPLDRPDTVVFLGYLVAVDTHYQLGNAHQKGRSLPCEGAICLGCAKGLDTRQSYYAPAIVSQFGEFNPAGRVWERVVYYIPDAAVEGFYSSTLRGCQFSVWRKRVGSSDRIRSRFEGRVAELAEPWFDVLPVVHHVFFRTDATRAALDSLLKTLAFRVTPPRFRRDEPLPASLKDQVTKLAQDQVREIMRAAGWKPPEERAAAGQGRGAAKAARLAEQVDACDRHNAEQMGQARDRAAESDAWNRGYNAAKAKRAEGGAA